jgi:hypothetical protein
MVELMDMVDAYHDCLRHKRGTVSAMEFSLNWMSECVSLTESVNARTYQPTRSICFVVTRPKLREVFAASFRDRVIHHYIALRLDPLFEQVFSERAFNCRKGKGQLYGVRRLADDLYTCSAGYTRDCWVMKLDLQGFFMSIDRRLMAERIDRFVCERYDGDDKDDLRYLCRTVVLHEPQTDCVKKSPQALFDALPDHKTLFRNERGKGIAIGNLFSQIFANYYLNDLDWFVDTITPYHGRYVDDFYLIHADKQTLLDAIPKIRTELAKLRLSLNEKKFYLQHYKKGVKFTGAVVLPGRSYCANRTVGGFVNAIHRLNKAHTLAQIKHAVQSVNSYLGFLRQHDGYAIRRKYLATLESRLFNYLYIKGNYESIVIKKQYRRLGID